MKISGGGGGGKGTNWLEDDIRIRKNLSFLGNEQGVDEITIAITLWSNRQMDLDLPNISAC